MKTSFKHLVIVAALSGAAGTTVAATTIINFDDVANGTAIDTYYPGVTFINALDGSSVYARTNLDHVASSPNIVTIHATGIAVGFDARSGAIEATFATGQQMVSIDAAIQRLPTNSEQEPINFPKLEIYNTAGGFVTSVNWDFSVAPQPPGDGSTTFETLAYTSTASDIGKVRFMSGQPGENPSNFGIFDNLVFTSVVPEPETYAMLLAGLGLMGWRFRRSCTSVQ